MRNEAFLQRKINVRTKEERHGAWPAVRNRLIELDWENVDE